MLVCPACSASYPEGTSACPEDGSALAPASLVTLSDPALAPGTMAGEYRVERRLGAGTFGAVYAGVQPVIGKRVAIKVLHRKFSSEPEVVSRFIAEARAVNRIQHKNIIDIFSFGLLEGGQHYFVMELLDGLTLGELLEREGKLSVAQALSILRGIADGLDAAHEAGVTHRDLKPDNIFLAAEKGGGYFPKLLDFGVAKLITEDMAHKTATGVAMGTPRYMSPEQTRGKNVDYRADIYAFGVVIHEMLTGQPLFHGDSVIEVLFKHMSDPPPPMSSVRADLPPELDAPVLSMLAKRPGARPKSAGEAVAALAEVARSLGLDRDDAAAASAGAPGAASSSAHAETVEVPSAPRAGPDEATVAVAEPASGDADRPGESAPATRPLGPPRVPEIGTVPAAPLGVDAWGPRADAPRGSPVPPAAAPPRAGRPWVVIVLASMGVALGAVALWRSGGEPAPATAPSAAPPIAAPLQVPSAVALEVEGDAPPVASGAASASAAATSEAAPAPAASAAASASASAGKPPVKPRVNKHLERPPELDTHAPKGAP